MQIHLRVVSEKLVKYNVLTFDLHRVRQHKTSRRKLQIVVMIQYKCKPENVAINNVLPLKAAWRCTIANVECFGARNISDLISMVASTFAMQRHFIRLASGPIICFRLAKFGWVAFADLRLPSLTMKEYAEFTKGG